MCMADLKCVEIGDALCVLCFTLRFYVASDSSSLKELHN